MQNIRNTKLMPGQQFDGVINKDSFKRKTWNGSPSNETD